MFPPDRLCTLAQVRDEAKVPDDDHSGDTWITNNLIDMGARLNVMTRQRYAPYYQEERYDAFGAWIDDTQRKLDLGRPLLYPTQVIDAFDNVLVFNTDFVFVQRDSPNMQLQLISDKVYGWSYGFGFGTYFWIAPGQFLRKIRVSGYWGYAQNYPQSWIDSLQTVTNTSGISATDRTIEVDDPSGMNGWGYSPALSAGNFIQVGDSLANPPVYEWMWVVATDSVSTTKTISVIRGVNGSTAQVWPKTTPISVWQIQPEINRAATRWLGYWYSRRGAYEAVKSDLSQGKTMIYPADAPTEILNTVAQTRDWGWAAV